MSPVNALSVLAFASAVLAIPHSHQHRHLHQRDSPAGYGSSSTDPSGSSSAPVYSGSSAAPAYATGTGYPYPAGNATGPWGSGTGYGTGYAQPTGYYPSSSAAPVCTASTTTCIWRGGSTSVSTIYPSSAAPESTTSAAPSYGDAQCTPDTTITTKVTETVTVTAGQEPSSPVSPAATSAAPSYGGEKAQSYPTDPAPSSAASPASAYSSSSPSSASPASYSPSSTARSSSGSSGFSGKRGLAYNDASLTDMFLGSSSIGWAFNWVSQSDGLSSKVSYIPELHSTSSDFTGSWMTDAQNAIDAGAQYLFGFNEPDMVSQANLDPSDAASAWKQYMEPFAGKAKLVAPAVTNGVGSGIGQDWLKQFIAACDGCTIDAVNQHWYDSTSNDVDAFKGTMESMSQASGGKPIFVGEFGAIGADSDISSFLSQVMPYMDSNDDILGYAYFKVGDGLLCNGNSPSSYGETYMN